LSDINRLMQAAADVPSVPFDPESAWRRGRQLRRRRTVFASAATLIVIVGAGFTVARSGSQEVPIVPAERGEESQPVEEAPCEDKMLATEDERAHCIARGTYDGSSWFYGAYLNDGELCIHLNEPGGGGGTGCGEARSARTVSPGLSSGGPGSPILTATVPEHSVSVVVETERGETVEAPVYDAPDELGLSLRFVLLFDLPKGAERVIAYDSSGNEIARSSLRLLLDANRSLQEKVGDANGWMIAFDVIDGESWDLSADLRHKEDLQCVTLGLGNDVEAADVELAATSCYEDPKAVDLSLEQMWWEGLEGRAPVFGLVGREVHKVELRLDDAEPQDIEIRRSPAEGLWRDRPVYEVDFVVAFPPLGATGEVVALDVSGKVVASWPLCMSERPQGAYGSCNQATEFWQPREQD
jgi:hypothetical protein